MNNTELPKIGNQYNLTGKGWTIGYLTITDVKISHYYYQGIPVGTIYWKGHTVFDATNSITKKDGSFHINSFYCN